MELLTWDCDDTLSNVLLMSLHHLPYKAQDLRRDLSWIGENGSVLSHFESNEVPISCDVKLISAVLHRRGDELILEAGRERRSQREESIHECRKEEEGNEQEDEEEDNDDGKERYEPPANESFTVPHKTTRISAVCGIGCLFPNGDSFSVIAIIEDEGWDPVFSSKMKRRDSILTCLKAADKMKGSKIVRERKKKHRRDRG